MRIVPQRQKEATESVYRKRPAKHLKGNLRCSLRQQSIGIQASKRMLISILMLVYNSWACENIKTREKAEKSTTIPWLLYFKSIVVMYRGRNLRTVSLSKYLQTQRYNGYRYKQEEMHYWYNIHLFLQGWVTGHLITGLSAPTITKTLQKCPLWCNL